LEVRFFFHKTTPEERQRLEDALVAMAGEKLRAATLGPNRALTRSEVENAVAEKEAEKKSSPSWTELERLPTPAVIERETPTETVLPKRRKTGELAGKPPRPIPPHLTPTETSAEGEEVAFAELAAKPLGEEDPYRGRRLGDVLIRMGKLDSERIEKSARSARLSGERLGRFLLREGLVTPLVLCRALALQSGLPMTDLSDVEPQPDLCAPFPQTLLSRLEFIPFDAGRRLLCVAAANPIPEREVRELEKLAGKKVEVFLAQEDLILLALDKLRSSDKRPERKHRRYEIAVPIQWQLCNRLGAPAEKETQRGLTRDVSEGGFSVVGTASKLGSPETVRRRGLCAKIRLEVAPRELHALCQVRFVKVDETGTKDASAPLWFYGLEILEMADADRRKLKELCLRSLEHDADEDEDRRRRKPFV
jgi:hypothetical protein